MTKVTSPDWPDPRDWVNRLHVELTKRQRLYNLRTDPAEKRLIAGAYVGALTAALQQLPPFRDAEAVLVLKDIASMFMDLDQGRRHPLAEPRRYGGTSITPTAVGELKKWVRAISKILQSSGYRPMEAYRRIAEGLTASGRGGKDGTSVRPEKIGRWCREKSTSGDDHIYAKAERWWQQYRADPTWSTDVFCVRLSDRVLAGQFADKIWPLDFLRDRFFSVGSE